MENKDNKWTKLYEDSKQTLKDMGADVEDDAYCVGTHYFHDNDTARYIEKTALAYESKKSIGLDVSEEYRTLMRTDRVTDKELEQMAEAGERYQKFKSAYEVIFPLPIAEDSLTGYFEIPTEDEYIDARDRAEELQQLIGKDFTAEDWKLAKKIQDRYRQIYKDMTYMDAYEESNPFNNTTLKDKIVDQCANEFDMSPAKIDLYLHPEEYLQEQAECEEKAKYPSPSMAYIVCCDMEKAQKIGPDGPDGPDGPGGPQDGSGESQDDVTKNKQSTVSKGDIADDMFGGIKKDENQDSKKDKSPVD